MTETRPFPPDDPLARPNDGPIGFMTCLGTEERAHGGPTRAVVSYLPKGTTSLPPSTFSLKYLVEGEEIYQGPDASRSVRSGQVLVAPSGQSLGVELRRPSAGLCLYFDVPEACVRTLPTLRLNAAEFELGRAISELAEAATQSEPGVELRVEQFLRETRCSVELLIEELQTANGRVGGVRNETRRQRLEAVTTGRMFLESHADRPVSLAEAAAAAGMSVFHFARQFSQVFGEAPAAFHERLRLRLASERLHSGATASAVARELGYSDLSVFSRAYARRYGVPPSRAADARD